MVYIHIGFSGKKFSRLTPGIHKIIVRFTVYSSRKEIPCLFDSESFEVGQIGRYEQFTV